LPHSTSSLLGAPAWPISIAWAMGLLMTNLGFFSQII
jgi:hypothetical protein